jgi:hypothetical protein
MTHTRDNARPHTKLRRYHVGLLAQGSTAVFQYRTDVDCLSCEILEYFGERETTKTAARLRLQQHGSTAVLADLNARYPRKQFTRVRID